MEKCPRFFECSTAGHGGFQQSLDQLSDEELLLRMEKLVDREREIICEVIDHLREVEKRKLYAREKYPSLFAYCIGKLKYSESQAQRRIVAARLVAKMPELESKIETGELNLTHLGLIHNVINQNPDLPVATRTNLIDAITSKTSREAELIVSPYLRDRSEPDRVRVVGAESLEIKFTASLSFEQKMKKLKGRLAHKLPKGTMAEVLEAALDLALNQTDPTRPPRNKSDLSARPTATEVAVNQPPSNKTDSAENAIVESTSSASPGPALDETARLTVACAENVKVQGPNNSRRRSSSLAAPKVMNAGPRNEDRNSLKSDWVLADNRSIKTSPMPLSKPHAQTRSAIPRPLRRLVFQNALSKCENCGSNYKLEIDHRIPIAFGGTNSLFNLRLLCRNCNQRAAIEAGLGWKPEQHRVR